MTSVLVIDGNEEHLALSVTALGRRGFKVSVADSSREGVRLALSQPFHVIVLAHKLRDGQGFVTLKTLSERLPEVPRIFVVPEGQEDLAVRSLNAGASGYLVKTARYYELLPTEVEEQLSKVKARARIQDQQKALEETQSRYREFVESSHAPIFVIDPSGRFVAFNDAMCSTTGYAREDLLKLNLFDILSPEGSEGRMRRLTDLLQGGPVGDLEFALQRKDGREVIIEVTPHLVRKEAEVVGIEVLARDITDRRRAEKELRDLYGWLEAIYEATNDAFLLADKDLRMVQWNTRALELFRMDSSTMAKQTADSLIGSLAERTKESRQALDALESYKADPGSVVEGALEIARPEPRVYWRLSAPVHSLEGAHIGRLWTFRDITDRRRAEEQIRYQANLVESVSDAIISMNNEARIASWNKAAETIYGWTAEEVLGQPAFEVLRTEFMHGSRKDADEQLRQRGFWRGELIERRKDGSPVFSFASVTELQDPEGNRVGVVSVNRDITERKKAEEAIRRRDTILAAVGLATDQFLRTSDWQACIQAVMRRLGEAAEVSRVWIIELNTRPDGTLVANQTHEWVAPGISSQANNPGLLQAPMRAGGFGRWETLLSRGEPVHGLVRDFPEGEREQLTAQDIRSTLVFPIMVEGTWWGHIGFDECTNEREWPASEMEALKAAAGALSTAIERQQALAALRARERQQAAVAELGQLGLAGTELQRLMDRATAIIAATLNVEFSKVLELAADGQSLALRAGVGWKPGLVGASMVPAGKDSQAGYTLLSKAPVIVNDLSAETRFSGPSLLRDHGVVSGLSVIIPGRERPYGVLGAHTKHHRLFTEDDVHFLQAVANALAAAIERNRAEQELRVSLERFLLVGRATNDIVWDWDLQRDHVYRSDAIQTVLGYTRDEAEPTDGWWAERIHPDDRERVDNGLFGTIRGGGQVWSDEYRIRRKDESFAIVYERGFVIRDEDGQPVRMIGSVMDVTRRRRAEQVQDATYRISAAAGSAQGLDELMGSIHRIVGGLMPAKNFYIALYNAEDETLSFPFFVDEFEAPPPPQKLGRGLTEYVLRSAKPLLASPEVFEDLVKAGEVELVGPPSIDWLGVPLVANGKTIGVLVTQSYTEGVRYKEDDRDILGFVSTQVAMAIERKRAEAELVRSERKFRTLFEAAAEGILLIDTQANLLDINPAGEAVIGGLREDLIGRNLKDFLPPEDLERARQYLRDVIHARPAKDPFEIMVHTMDNRRRALEVRSRVVREGRDEPYVEMAVRDVTDEKEMQRRLVQSERLASVGKISAYVAHEINTPLTNISLLTASLARRIRDQELLEKLEKINVQRRNAANIISDLLKFAKHREINPTRMDIRTVLGEALEQVESYRRAEVGLVKDLGDQPVEVNVDPIQLQEVFVNLVKNAYEATSEGSVIVRLEIRRDEVLVRVTDTGSGMTPDVLSRLFEPFFSTKRFGEGTGLGLPLCQNIVQAHGGRIEVSSTLGKGSTFSVLLPRGGIY